MYNVIIRNIKQNIQKSNMGYYNSIIDHLKPELFRNKSRLKRNSNVT